MISARLIPAIALLAIAAPALAVSERPLQSATVPLAAAAAQAEVTFIVGGDSRPTAKGAPVPRTEGVIFSEIALIRPDFVLWSGDTIYGYGDNSAELSNEYDGLFRRLGGLGVPFFNAPGNHEIHAIASTPCDDHATEEEYQRRFGQLYGSFDDAGIHFIALDTAELCHDDLITGDQLDWLRRDLEANKSARAIFVFCHTEFFSAPHIDPAQAATHPAIRNLCELTTLFRTYPVRAVFAGHEHAYSRETHDSIEYFVAGGGGAPLYADADQGGFSHYVLVNVRGSEVSYHVIEPGRIYVESAPSPVAGQQRFWLVNGTNTDVPAHGLTVSVPGSLGACKDLIVQTDLRDGHGAPIAVPAKITDCQTEGQMRRVRIDNSAPRRSSVPIRLVPTTR